MRSSVVYQALRRPRLNYGVTPKALGSIWGPIAFVSVIIGSNAGWLYALFPVSGGLIIHAVVRWAYRKDHRVFEIMARYSNMADEYHPHSREVLPDPFKRPAKVGRGIRI